MNRSLQYVNFFGVLALAAGCVVQWRINREVNQEASRLEQTRLEQGTKLQEQTKAIQGYSSDLDTFRQQLSRATTALKECESKLKSAEQEIAQLARERDQLKESVTHWANAVSLRDERLKEGNNRITRLVDELTATVHKFNELSTNNATVVKDLNERTRQFNELVVKYNAAVRPSAPPKD